MSELFEQHSHVNCRLVDRFDAVLNVTALRHGESHYTLCAKSPGWLNDYWPRGYSYFANGLFSLRSETDMKLEENLLLVKQMDPGGCAIIITR